MFGTRWEWKLARKDLFTLHLVKYLVHTLEADNGTTWYLV